MAFKPCYKKFHSLQWAIAISTNQPHNWYINLTGNFTKDILAALSYCARRYDSAICYSKMSKKWTCCCSK